MQHEAEVMADEPSVQFSDGVPFASPLRRQRQEEQSMAEVDAVLANVTNVFETVPEDDHEEQEEKRDEEEQAVKKTRRTKSKVTKDAVYDQVPRFPKRKPRANAKPKKGEQENVSSEPEMKRTARKVSKATGKAGHADLRKRQKTETVFDDDEDGDELVHAREQRMKLYKDLETYNLEEELVI